MKSSRQRSFRMPERSRSERLLLGVCSGIASRFQLDVTLVRLAFLFLVPAWGLGVVLYLGLWLLTPTEGARPVRGLRAVMGRNVGSIRLEMARSRRRLKSAWIDGRPGEAWPRPLGRRWLGIALIAVGMVVVLGSLGMLSWVTPWRAIGLGVVAIGGATLVSLNKSPPS